MAIVFLMDNAPRPQLDAGRALQQMELTAWAEGVGTCFVGVRQEEQQRQIKELLGIPAELELITILPFGYRDDTATRESRPRKALRDIVHGETFGQGYSAS
jgi:nitroreductase